MFHEAIDGAQESNPMDGKCKPFLQAVICGESTGTGPGLTEKTTSDFVQDRISVPVCTGFPVILLGKLPASLQLAFSLMDYLHT